MVSAPERLTLSASRRTPRARMWVGLLAAAFVAPLLLPLAWSGYRLAFAPGSVRAALSNLEAPWSIRDPLGGVGLLPLPPETVAAALQSNGSAVFADWRWAPTLQAALPAQQVLGSKGIAGESDDYWMDYLRVVQGHERWDTILRDMNARVLLVPVD